MRAREWLITIRYFCFNRLGLLKSELVITFFKFSSKRSTELSFLQKTDRSNNHHEKIFYFPMKVNITLNPVEIRICFPSPPRRWEAQNVNEPGNPILIKHIRALLKPFLRNCEFRRYIYGWGRSDFPLL